MKSVYIRELRHYTKIELTSLFPEIDSHQFWKLRFNGSGFT